MVRQNTNGRENSDAPFELASNEAKDSSDESHWSKLAAQVNKVSHVVGGMLPKPEIMKRFASFAGIKVIVVMGVTGHGKSSFVKTITGANAPIGTGANSMTKDWDVYAAKIHGTKYVIVDTPGFEDAHTSDFEILQKIQEFFSVATGYTKISGVLYVHSMQDERIRQSNKLILDVLAALCGESFFPKVTFVTTHWDRYKDEEEIEEAEEILETWKPYWKRFLDGEARLYRHHGVNKRSKDEVKRQESTKLAQDMMRFYHSAPQRTMQIEDELRRGIAVGETTAAMLLRDNKPEVTQSDEKPDSKAPQVNNIFHFSSPPTQRQPIHPTPEPEEKSWWWSIIDRMARAFTSLFF